MRRHSSAEPSDSAAPGVIPGTVRVNGQPPLAHARAAPVMRSSKRHSGSAAAPRERPSASHANGELDAANRQWRRKIVSHAGGLKPHVDPNHDHLRGPDEATVTLVEYGDYQSPACIATAKAIEQLRNRFDGQLRFAFRHFPLGATHPLALHAAEAAEAAGAQGRFWEMHDLIYRRDQGLEPALLRNLAKAVELDLERFDSELADETHLRHVMEDFQSGVDSGVNGTPTFFINAERIDWDFEMATIENDVKRAIRAA